MDQTLLLDKTFACLAAAAIGDVMGAAVECWHYEAIREKYGIVRDLLPDKGYHLLRRGYEPYHWTDDTVLRNAIIRAIIRKGGRINAYDLRTVWLEELNPSATNPLDTIAFMKLAAGTPARENGEGLPVCITAALGIAPIGIINACDPETAAEDAFDIACMTQWKEGREAAMAIAAGVAEAFKADATLESVIQASISYCGPIVRSCIETALEIARRYENPVEMIPEYYEKILVEDGWSGPIKNDPDSRNRIKADKWSFGCHPLELVPVAFGMFYASRGDVLNALIGSVNFGRDCDGIAGFAGCLAATLNGSKGLDMRMVDKVNRANGCDLMEMAEEMQPAMMNVLCKKEKTVERLRFLVNEKVKR